MAMRVTFTPSGFPHGYATFALDEKEAPPAVDFTRSERCCKSIISTL